MKKLSVADLGRKNVRVSPVRKVSETCLSLMNKIYVGKLTIDLITETENTALDYILARVREANSVLIH